MGHLVFGIFFSHNLKILISVISHFFLRNLSRFSFLVDSLLLFNILMIY